MPAPTSPVSSTRSIATVMWSARRLRGFMSVEAGALTTWSPQIFEFLKRALLIWLAETTWQTGRRCPFVANRNCRRSTSWRMSWIRAQRLYWRAEDFSRLRSLWSGPFGSWNDCGEQAPLTCEGQRQRFERKPAPDLIRGGYRFA